MQFDSVRKEETVRGNLGAYYLSLMYGVNVCQIQRLEWLWYSRGHNMQEAMA
jgi:hypothetical protein